MTPHPLLRITVVKHKPRSKLERALLALASDPTVATLDEMRARLYQLARSNKATP